ncbi:TPA: hypothetical protein UZ441_004783 [Escherichia coli]|nr:hypothetical protein [Escherichia coli]HEL8025910.1 hypothetical protein [Escherichia coli]HEL8044669.1 hypothetical protein [Escherichia coli]HEL8049434.1 hypothetical protein [Escherichia coli]HEL8054193.1 hypothetical protein [Escherichia coli]
MSEIDYRALREAEEKS